jgi:hypothetical protein
MKGGYYSFDGAVATGAPAWGRGSEMGEFASTRGGNNTVYGAGRKRKQTRKRRTMKGGSKYGAVSASYMGTGERGMANYVQSSTKTPPFGGPEGGAFNNAGAQPGSGFGSFVRM